MHISPRGSIRDRRQFTPGSEPLESRALLSSTGHAAVELQVPSTYISQQSSQLDVTLVRPVATSRAALTVDFSATNSSAAGNSTASAASAQPFVAVNQSVTFPAGQTTETVAVPINAQAANPGLVPIQLAVTPTGRQSKRSTATVYLAESAQDIPPAIIGVQRVAGGIAITFSKPMSPAAVDNIHNYSITFSSTKKFSLENLYGVGLVQALDNSPTAIPIRRASYDATTNTVTLITNEPLGPNGSYRISNPASLLSKRARPGNAQPLTDAQGNILVQGGTAGNGTFSITISKGKPYSVAAPALFTAN